MIERTKRYVTEKKYMKFVKDVLESYEDVSMMSVIDEDKGLIEFVYPASQEEELREIIEDLRVNRIPLLEIEGGEK